MSIVDHLSVKRFGASCILPLVVDGTVYGTGVSGNKIILNSLTKEGVQTDRPITLPEDLDLNTIRIAPHNAKKTFVVTYNDVEGKPFIAVIDLDGGWVSGEGHVIDTIIPGAPLYFDEPRVLVADGAAMLTIPDYVIEDDTVSLDVTSIKLGCDVDSKLTGVMRPVFPGKTWCVLAMFNNNTLENKPLLYALYKNRLSRLPIDCVQVCNAVAGIEIVKYKPGAKRHVSSFIPGDMLDAAVTGDRKKLKTIVKKDNTDIGGYIGVSQWFKDGDAQLSTAILSTQGVLISTVDGHVPIGQPLYDDTVIYIGIDRAVQISSS